MIRKYLLLYFFILSSSHLFAQKSTVCFYRLKSIYLANASCTITVNDSIKFTINNDSYYLLKTQAELINLLTEINNIGINKLALEKDKTYYIQVEMESSNKVNLILQSTDAGKAALERLQTDENIKDINTELLNTERVTSIAPIPEAPDDTSIIYLFRPFNVVGISMVTKITDGKSLYEMKSNSSKCISTNKEEITLTSVNEGASTSNSTLKLKLGKGKIYYVAILRSGGAIILTETKEEYAKKEMKL